MTVREELNEKHHQTRGGQQGSTQHDGNDPEKTKAGGNKMESSKADGRKVQRHGEDFEEKDEQRKGGDPDNPSDTTGATESGSEDQGAKR